MKFLTAAASLTLLFVSPAQATMNDLFYFPEKSKVDGATGLQIVNSDMSGSLAGLNFDITTRYTAITQAVAFGLTDELAIGLSAPYVLNGTIDLNLAGLTGSEDYQTGFQSPTLSLSKRTQIRSLEHPLSYLDVKFFVTPANSDENSVRSDYMGLGLATGTELNEAQKIRFGLSYTSYNATGTVKEQTQLNLNVAYQKNLENGFLYQLGAAIMQWSDQELKSVPLSFEYSYTPVWTLAFGRSVEAENFDWLVSYEFYQSAMDINASGTNFDADNMGNSLGFTGAYRF